MFMILVKGTMDSSICSKKPMVVAGTAQQVQGHESMGNESIPKIQ
jgi:hypothetical protein